MRYKAYLVSVNSKKFSIRATHKNLPVLVFSASELWTGYDQAKAWLRCKKLPPDIDSGGVFCNDREGMVTFSRTQRFVLFGVFSHKQHCHCHDIYCLLLLPSLQKGSV